MKTINRIGIKIGAIAVIAWGIALRAVEVLNGNYLFGFDQGRDYLAAYNIAVNHKLTLIGAEVGAGFAGLNGLFHGSGYYYILSVMHFLFHGDPYGGLLLMLIFGTAALVLTYFFTKNALGNATAIISTFLVAISPLLAPQSRFIWNHHPTTFFIIIFFFFMYRINKRPRVYAPLAVFTACFIYHFELAIAVPLAIAACLSFPFIFHIKDIKTYIYCFIALIVALSPLFLFEIRHGWMAFRSFWTYIIGGSLQLPVAQTAGHLKAFLYNAVNSFPTEKTFLPEGAYIALVYFLIAFLMYLSFHAKPALHKKFFRFLLLTLAVSYGVLFFLRNDIWDYYLIHAHIVYIFIFAYAATFFWKNKRKSFSNASVFIVLSVYFVAMTISTTQRMIINYTYDYHDLGGIEKIKGKKIAIDHIYKDANGRPFSAFIFVPAIYTYPYDYLFLTYAKEKYGYAPGKNKIGLVYLIIEPDHRKPWTYKGWLETVIKDGNILNTQTLKTGHIIQKRMFPL